VGRSRKSETFAEATIFSIFRESSGLPFMVYKRL
jgi:hypothetical protein